MTAPNVREAAPEGGGTHVQHPAGGRMRWWGWGEDGHDRPPSRGVERMLREELGADPARRTPPVALDDVALPPAALPGAVRARLAGVVGAEHVRDDRLARVTHAYGRSYPDHVRLRAGDASAAPDAVVAPGSAAEVADLLALCAAESVAVVPFGGGTSVVGGVEAVRGPFAAVVSLDLARLDRVLAVDRASLTATVEPGVTGPALEHALAAHGLTFGHFPQSWEFSTVGGWVATRSAGQSSTGYGRSDDRVLGLRLATPTGELVAHPYPATAAGPDLRELVVGSEGALGVVTEATLALHPAPAVRHHEAFALPSFAAGVEALRALEQAGRAPHVVRLSDEEETRVNLAAAPASRATRALAGYLAVRRRARGCLLVLGWEGTAASVARERVLAAGLLARGGAVALGPAPGRAWARGRFHGAYTRDALLERGVLVDTLETATSWSGLLPLYRAVGAALRRALAGRATPPLVLCHVSHLYATGASLYFTFLARQEAGAELEQWQAAKVAAGDAIRAAGGTITHHHAVGRDHAPWHADEVGERGLAVLRAVKATLDPAGIMNPGVLVPTG
jgi:alkyldihydroxyacetonephosphate synthase